MRHPDNGVPVSICLGGDVADEPQNVISVVVTDEEDNPAGVLEKWSSEEWIYASADSLHALEPEPADGESY